MANTTTCCECGQRIVGLKRMYGGRAYCEACYNALMAKLAEIEAQKVELYRYICNLFGKNECPEFVSYNIDKAITSGKKVSGIRATIWWFYEIEGHPTDNINGVAKVIEDQYENARKYVQKQKEIMKANEKVDLNNVPSQNITISSRRNVKKWKPNYRMEDL